ncbi:uncharacterized protein LOC143033780 [Oratosquilla oratoria]|uniref:uncharacterized protein LOC143033780 n=1 Tax=Oratosquilla oratoria TaxID=337810 RepID=UPI003F77449A
MSNDGEQQEVIWQEYHRRRKLDRCVLQRKFLQDCLEEKVLPKSAPKQLVSENNPFDILHFTKNIMGKEKGQLKKPARWLVSRLPMTLIENLGQGLGHCTW